MTNEEKQKILEGAVNMAYSVLQDATPDEFMTGDVRNLLGTIDELDFMIRVRDDMNRVSEALAENPVPAPVTPAPTVARVDEPVTPAPAESQYSMTDVRAALAKARSKGVNVSDIIRAFGVDNFTALDASKYPAVMEKLAAEGAV